MILCIESTSNICSVCLVGSDGIINIKESFKGASHASELTQFIQQVCPKHLYSQLQAISISSGPGSFTGLRIGTAIAKGLAYTLNIPLIDVGTLNALTFKLLQEYKVKEDTILAPMIDARRQEVYTCLFDTNLNSISPVQAQILHANMFSQLEKEVWVFGNGAAKAKQIIKSSKVKFIENIAFSAANLSSLAYQKLNNNVFKDVAYFEPNYLKEYLPKKSKAFF